MSNVEINHNSTKQYATSETYSVLTENLDVTRLIQESEEGTYSNQKASIRLHEASLPEGTQDVVLSALSAEEALYAPSVAQKKKSLNTPQLPPGSKAPSSNNGLGDGDILGGEGPSIIALIGAVLALQAKTTSNFWSIQFQQTSTSMTMAIQLAPIIKDAVQANWNSQADATDQEADMAKKDGIFAVGSGVMALGMGGYEAFNSLKEEAPAEELGAKNLTEEAATKGTDATKAANDLSSDLAANDKSLSGKLTRGWKAFSGGAGKVTKGLFKSLSSAASFGQFSIAMSNGMAQLTVDSPAKAAIAGFQRKSGSADALSKVCEQYSQYYNQDFSRNEDLRQGAQQNIDYAMNLLKSASDSVSQVVISMFRG